ncbi:MAG TPA: hypothetical protein VMS56_03030 [Thermoanaerobaculia bacterium]|nr:hypothetical protein [Thermoanaerobaculia bacterium]
MLADFLRMWRLLLILLALASILLVGWIVVPMFSEATPFALESEPELQRLALRAPADAHAIVLVRSFGPAWRRLDPLAGSLIESEGGREALGAAAWLLGPSPVAFWTTPEGWGAAAAPDPLRALVMRLAGPFLPGAVIAQEDGIVLLNPAADSMAAAVVPPWADGLPAHAFVVHLGGGGYPPLSRPAISAITFDDSSSTAEANGPGSSSERLRLVTRARSDGDSRTIPLDGKSLPANALLAIRFAEPPEALLAIDRAVPIRLADFLADGGLAALYGIDTSGIVPRPRMAFGLPADDARAAELLAAIDRLTIRGTVGFLLGMQPDRTRLVGEVEVTRREGIGLTVEFARRGGEFLFAFDSSSLEQLLIADPIPAGEGSGRWSLRASPDELRPVLHELGRNEALRLFAREFSNEVRELERGMAALPAARELRARVVEGEGVAELSAEAELAK